MNKREKQKLKKEEDGIKYTVTKDYMEELRDFAKKVDRDMFSKIVLESYDKITEVNAEKIIGVELTLGQYIILLDLVCERLQEILNRRTIKHYGFTGKDNKRKRKELESLIQSIFVEKLMEME